MSVTVSTDLEETYVTQNLDPNNSETWPEAMTLTEVAEVLRVEYRTVRQWVADGRIQAKHLSTRNIRVSKQWLLAYLAREDS